MSELAPPVALDQLPPPSAQVINKVADTSSAAELMASLNGEIKGVSLDLGFSVLSKNPNGTSEDVAYAHKNNRGEVFIGVFDGMGGHDNGRLAAEIAQNQLHKVATEDREQNIGIRGFTEDVFDGAVEQMRKTPELGNGGATGLIGVIQDVGMGKRMLSGAAVGDSVGFVVRANGTVEQLNQEETYEQELLSQGVDPSEAERQGNVITNGLIPRVYKDVNQRFSVEVNDGDVIVFTSDGITGDNSKQRLSGGGSNEEVIAKVALDTSLTPKQRAEKLIELATKKDDRTAIVVEVGPSVADQKVAVKFDMIELKNDWHGDNEQIAKEGSAILDVAEVEVEEVLLDSQSSASGEVVEEYSTYDRLFDPAFDSSSLSVEGAAVRRSDMFKMINMLKADSYGGMKRLDSEAVKVLREGLEELGVLADKPTAEELVDMHKHAAELVKNGKAEGYLRSLPFTSMRELISMKEGAKRSVINWSNETPLYIDPSVIESGGSDFLSWAGDSQNRAKTRTTADGQMINGTTYSAIEEYAVNYDTQLPQADTNGLNIIINKDGARCYVTNGVHRTAAAKLRGEPLRFSSIVLYDAR